MNKDGEYFYWEDMSPTDIYAKKDGTTLYLRSTQLDSSYVKGTKWNDTEITKVVIEEPIAPRTCYEMFFNCTALEEIENIENLHTENSTHMRSMFSDCNNLNSLNLKYFDTSNVTSMYLMFNSCKALTSIDISNFDTCNVKDMYGMFANCENVTTINLSNINTDKTSGSMAYMFNHCHKLTSLDLTKFNTQNITYMNYMFNYCRVLKKIYVSDNWTVNNVSNSSSLFNGCGKLVGGNGTTYDSEHVDETYARIDGGPNSSTPGYFTLKEN